MNYENVDENVDENATYKIACENVKKIANAIKLLKIKYYPNFDRISEEDKKTFDELQIKLNKISEENGLDDLKVALMGEISSKYDQKSNEENQGLQSSDDMLKACYGATDAEVTALSHGKIKQAKKCQEILNKYLDGINSKNYRELITEYRRKKFGELTRTRENNDKETARWSNNLSVFYKPQDIEARRVISGIIKNISKTQEKQGLEQENQVTDELEIG